MLPQGAVAGGHEVSDYARSLYMWMCDENRRHMSDADVADWWTMQNARVNIAWWQDREGVK